MLPSKEEELQIIEDDDSDFEGSGSDSDDSDDDDSDDDGSEPEFTGIMNEEKLEYLQKK